MSVSSPTKLPVKSASVRTESDMELIETLVNHHWDECYEAVLTDEKHGLGATIMELDRRYGNNEQRLAIEEEFEEIEDHKRYLDQWMKKGR